MTSHALTITRTHLDVFLFDTREFGCLVSDQFQLDLYLDQGLANFNPHPHSELVPFYYGDTDPNCYLPHQMNAAITLVDGERVVLDQVEFILDARITRMLGLIIDWQADMGWTREVVEWGTWLASRGTGMDGTGHPYQTRIACSSHVPAILPVQTKTVRQTQICSTGDRSRV